MTRGFAMTLALLAGCGTEVGGYDDDPTSAQVPPRGAPDLSVWLDSGLYMAWACELEPHPARPRGAHGSTRICNNAALVATSEGLYPVGAASVKELYRDGVIVGHAMTRKITEGTAGSSWYWYESFGDELYEGAPALCTGCHRDAPRDFVFTRVE